MSDLTCIRCLLDPEVHQAQAAITVMSGDALCADHVQVDLAFEQQRRGYTE